MAEAKKINEVEKVTTLNADTYVLLNTVDGDTVQIKKIDFANAIADVLPAIRSNYVEGHEVMGDLNFAYLDREPGLYVGRIVAATTNKPSSISSGEIIYSLRYIKNNISTSQFIFQLAYNGTIVAYRTGRGNGTEIIYTDWKSW